jgi:UDPglucose 6-dehydrogenase
MKLIIAGHGFVGSAVSNAFKHYCELEIVDPKYSDQTVSEIDADGIIICVPTPENSDGSCNVSYIESVLEDVPESMPVLLKSTVSLEGWEHLINNYPAHNITFNPEFLTAKNSHQDFLDQQQIYLGGGNIEFWVTVYRRVFSNAEIKISLPKELILTKYVRNCFLATKVAFFNQIYDLCQQCNVNFDSVREYVADDERIGESHSFVYDNDRGFGGACFPKDTRAFLETSKLYKADLLSILEEAVNYNFQLRK